MPVSRHRLHDTQKPQPSANGHGDLNNLRTPQARVLRELMPDDPSDYWTEWPLLTRTWLCLRAGFKIGAKHRPTSGSITRVLNGIGPNNTTSGKPHLGLLGLGLVEVFMVYLDSGEEVNYRITAAGIAAYQAHVVRTGRKLPAVKDASLCINDRYRLPQRGGA